MDSTTTKLFNQYAKGRCSDKFRAMANLCKLDEKQYDILVDKWCLNLRRMEIAEKEALSLRDLDRKYSNSKKKIMRMIEKYHQNGFSGRFFFELDMKLNGNDWSKYIQNGLDEEDEKSDRKITEWLFAEDKNKDDNINNLAGYLGFKK